jgi:hypothetical protein
VWGFFLSRGLQRVWAVDPLIVLKVLLGPGEGGNPEFLSKMSDLIARDTNVEGRLFSWIYTDLNGAGKRRSSAEFADRRADASPAWLLPH